MPRKNLVGRVGEFLQEATGLSLVDTEHLRVSEATAREAYFLANDLEEIGYVSLNHHGGRSSEPTAISRRRWAQQARVVWLADPMAGASTEMLNEFTFGRGVSRPRLKDKEAQKLVDEAWDDPQNQRVLTSFVAQIKLGNSLSIQSNVFFTMYDDADDGKVQLSFLNHDTVRDVQTDTENRQRALFYVATVHKQEWDYEQHRPKPNIEMPKYRYYENWGAVEEALRERGLEDDAAKQVMERYRTAAESQATDDKEEPLNLTEPYKVPGIDDGFTLPPPGLLGAGKVYHLAENYDMEMIFGVPRMRRTIRWYTAYNTFMKARVDMMAAAASFIMTKTVEGSPTQIEKLASKAMRASSDLRANVQSAVSPDGVKEGPRPGSILGESGGVKFEPLRLDSGAGNAMTDGQMLRAQVSAGDRWPQHYLGDVGNANLATATSMELPVLKHVEARQELVEGLFRWFIDRVIERAIESGKLSREAPKKDQADLVATGQSAPDSELALSAATVETHDMLWRINGVDQWRETKVIAHENGNVEYALCAPVSEAHEDKGTDEAATGRDLSYEFGLPSPLRRTMLDLVSAAAQTATMADPNGVMPELTRVLLTLIFSEGFEMPDAADVVNRIMPPGFDPMQKLAEMQQQMGAAGGAGGAAGGPQASQPNFFGPNASGQPSNPDNAYSAPQRATAPEDVRMQQAVLMEGEVDDWEVPPMVAVGRAGQPVYIPGKMRGGQRTGQVPLRVNGRLAVAQREFDAEVSGMAMEELAALDMGHLGGNGKP